MSDGYETLQASLRRVSELREERDERERELGSLGKRVESLYREAMGDEEGAKTSSPENTPVRNPVQAVKDFINDKDDDFESGSGSNEKRFSRKIPRDPLDQLNQMIEELERQQHWIRKRRQLKEQDVSLRKQNSSHARAIERYEQNRRSLWAQCGVATQQTVSMNWSIVNLLWSSCEVS